MMVTADALQHSLGKTLLLLFLSLEMARRGKKTLFLSASEWTDGYMQIQTFKGQETFFLDQDYLGESPSLDAHVLEPYPGLHYLAAPRTRTVKQADLHTVRSDLDYEMVISEYCMSPSTLSFYLFPSNIQFFRDESIGWQRTETTYALVAGIDDSLLTEERKQIYRSFLGEDTCFLRWEPLLSLIPFERTILDFFVNEQHSPYLADVRSLSDLLCPPDHVQEATGTYRLFKKLMGKK